MSISYFSFVLINVWLIFNIILSAFRPFVVAAQLEVAEIQGV